MGQSVTLKSRESTELKKVLACRKKKISRLKLQGGYPLLEFKQRTKSNLVLSLPDRGKLTDKTFSFSFKKDTQYFLAISLPCR